MSDRKIVYKTRQEMIEDLEGTLRSSPYSMSNQELEIHYNTEFYGGFQGIEYKILAPPK